MSDEHSSDGRRKRRGGLRVPSDNVPRKPHSESGDSIPVPVPEPIGLAASISESFGVASEPIGVALTSTEEMSETPDEDELPTIVSEPKPLPSITSSNPDLEPTDDIGMTTLANDTIISDTEDTGEQPSALDTMKTTEIRASDIYRQSIGESVDIPFDDGEETLNTQIPGPLPGPDLTARTHDAPKVVFRHETDVSATPVSATPVSATPVSATPVSATPVSATPVSATPVSSTPVSSTPVLSASSKETSVVDTPTKKKPRFARALTMALNESDLEEVRNNVEEVRNKARAEETQNAKGSAGIGANEGSPSSAVPTSLASEMESGDVLADDELEEVSGSATAIQKEDDESLVKEIVPDKASAPQIVSQPSSDSEKVPTTAKNAAQSEPSPKKVKEEPPPPPPPSTPKSPPPIANLSSPPKPPEDRKKRRPKSWFDEIFDEDYLRTLPFLTPQATQFEANFVMESLGVDAGAQILDVGCGYGRHAMELAARGYHLVGLDNSLPLLLRGADEAQRRGLTINFIHGDMREMTFESQFDGAYCLFSSFGYFDDETNKQTAQNIAKALKPGARFVVEVLNRDYLVADLPSRIWWEGDGCVVLEEVEFNYFSSRIVSNRSVVFDDGRQLEQEISLRSFSLHELGKFLHSVGFRVLEISGSMSTRGRFFGAHSRDIVVVAERKAD